MMTTNLRAPGFRVILVVLLYCGQLPSYGQDATVLENNKKVITRYFDMVINAHRIDRKAEFFHTDYILHTMDGKVAHDKVDSMHTNLLKWLFNAIPDVHYAIDNIVAGGEMVGVSTTATGNARSEMFGLPTAQKKVRYTQMFFYRLKDGKITDQWEVVDPDGITAQVKQQ